MKIDDLEGGSTWVVGLSFCFPPCYARYDASRGLWQWTERLARATGFPTRELAQEHIDRIMGRMPVDTWPDEMMRWRVKPLKVELKVGA